MAPPAPSPWNVANALTMTRIAMVPLFAWAFVQGDDVANGVDAAVVWRVAAVVIFVAAAVTDRLDGYLARSRGLVTTLGKILDPIADKLLIGTALVLLSTFGELPWWITLVILVREIGVTVMRLAVLRYAVIPVTRGGKLKTVIQSVAIGVYLLPLEHLPAVVPVLAAVLMGLAVALTVVTGVDYVRKGIGVPAAAATRRATAPVAHDTAP